MVQEIHTLSSYLAGKKLLKTLDLSDRLDLQRELKKYKKWALTHIQSHAINSNFVDENTKIIDALGSPKIKKEYYERLRVHGLLNPLSETPTPAPTPEIDVLAEKRKELAERKAKLELLEEENRLARAEAQAKADEAEILQTQIETSKVLLALTQEQVVIVEELTEATYELSAITEQYNQALALQRAKSNIDRVFTNHQRSLLYLNAGGKCQQCGDGVTISDFEADHIIPYSKGGPTTLENGQCLCRSCNRKKGSK